MVVAVHAETLRSRRGGRGEITLLRIAPTTPTRSLITNFLNVDVSSATTRLAQGPQGQSLDYTQHMCTPMLPVDDF
jgi:hypothetical protein